MPRKDKDFLPAFVMNQILGGGVMSSRLWEEVREKRGAGVFRLHLRAAVQAHLGVCRWCCHQETRRSAQSLDLINAELKRIAIDGPTETELANAKSYLTGSFALRFDTNAKIANQLLWVLQEDLGKDYIDRRNAEIEAVTLDQLKAVAKRMFEGQELITTVVGKPKGLAPKG